MASAKALNLAPDARLSSENRSKLIQVLDAAAQKLPPSVFELLDKRNVQVIFAQAARPSIEAWVSGTGLFGNKRSISKIYVSDKLVSDLNSSQGEKTESLLADLEGRILHEIGHIYDESERYTPEERVIVNRCNQDRLRLMSRPDRNLKLSDIDSYLSRECQKTFKKFKLLSDSYRYQMLAGFKDKVFNKNNSDARSANPYEMQSAEEHYAENFRLFLSDPEYRCRRPAFYRFFSDHFRGFEPKNRIDECPLRFRLSHSGKILDIDRDRLFEIQYLLAGKGKGMESRFGHSLVRLVICRQGRPRGPDCRLDLDDHLTIALNGDVDDLRMNPLKGVFGYYKSSFSIATFRETLREYNKDQFRSISSYPLKLDRSEMLQLTDLLLQEYWEYQGTYYFFGRNCSSELGETMRAAFRSNDFLYETNMTPMGLLKSLEKNSYLNAKNFEFFPSHKVKLQEQLDQLSRELRLGPINLDDFLDTTPESRLKYFNELSARNEGSILEKSRALFQEGKSKEALSTYLLIPAVFSLLENYSADQNLIYLSKKKQNVLVRFIEKNEGLENLKAPDQIRQSFAEMRKIRGELRVQALPDFLGYGSPSDDDLTDISDFIKSMQEKQNRLSKTIGLALDELFPEEVQEIEARVRNRNFFVDTLKSRAHQFRNEVAPLPSR